MRLSSDLLLRLAALGTSAGTMAFLVIGGGLRASNPFLVPDLIVIGALCVAAVQPASTIRPVMLVAFGIAVGVFSTATADYLVQGRIGIGPVVALAASVLAVMALLPRPARRV